MLVQETSAATLVRIDFHEPLDGNNKITANTVTDGASAEFVVQGDSPALDAGTGVGAGVIPPLANGYVTLDRANSNYIQSSSTSGTRNGNAEYRDYVPGNTSKTLAAVTVYMVIQPGTTTGTNGLFASAANSSGGQTTFSLTSKGLLAEVGHSNGKNAAAAALSGLRWDSSSWYFVAMSYGTGSATNVYYRVLKDASGRIDPHGAGTLEIGDTMPAGSISVGALAAKLIFGAMTNPLGAPQNFFDGKLAYLDVESGYSDLADYEAIFNSLIVAKAEPAGLPK